MANPVKTQDTELFFLDPSGDVWTKVGCPLNINVSSPTKGEIDVTCLSSKAPRTIAGFGDAGEMTFDIMPDPQEASHTRLYALSKGDKPLKWAIGWCDGDSAPSSNELPDTRTWLSFEGEPSGFSFAFAVNDVVRSDGISITIDGDIDWLPKEV